MKNKKNKQNIENFYKCMLSYADKNDHGNQYDVNYYNVNHYNLIEIYKLFKNPSYNIKLEYQTKLFNINTVNFMINDENFYNNIDKYIDKKDVLDELKINYENCLKYYQIVLIENNYLSINTIENPCEIVQI
jgi:hypothetical protein